MIEIDYGKALFGHTLEKVEFKPKGHIDEYLNSPLNFKIYEELSEDSEYKGLFGFLDLFNLLYEIYLIIRANRDKPTVLIDLINGLGLDKEQLHFLLRHLDALLAENNKTGQDEKLKIFRKLIIKERSKLYSDINQTDDSEDEVVVYKTVQVQYDFEKVKHDLKSINSSEEKISHLMNLKTEYLQNKTGFESPFETPFDEKCQLEIDNLKEQAQLNKKVGEFTEANIQPIWWRSTGRSLRYLFEELTKYDLIERSSPINKHIKEHFIDKNKIPFTNSIKQNSSGVSNNKSGKPKGHEKIDKIIKELREPE